MSTEANDTTPAPELSPEAAPPAGGKRERPPPSPEKARRAAAAKRLKRAVEKALENEDPEALERAAAVLSGGAPASAPVSESEAGAALAVAAPPAAPAPSAEELAAMTSMANGLFAMVAAPLAGTRFDPMVPRPNPMGGEPIIPAQAVVQAAGPVLAKYLPAAVGTPEGQLALALALWLVPPALELATTKMAGEGNGAGAEGAGVKAA